MLMKVAPSLPIRMITQLVTDAIHQLKEEDADHYVHLTIRGLICYSELYDYYCEHFASFKVFCFNPWLVMYIYNSLRLY